MNLSADLNIAFFAEKKEVFLKVEPKRSSLVQDVGLRQRGLGGIPVGAVSGTCKKHRDEKFTGLLPCWRNKLCLCEGV